MPLNVLTKRIHTHFKHVSRQLLVLCMLVGILIPFVMSTDHTHAAQLTGRSVAISTSKASATATYIFTFSITASTVGSISFQACTTPLGTCTAPGGTTNMNAGTTAQSGWAAGTFTRSTAGTGATGNCQSNSSSTSNYLCITRTAAAETAGSRTITQPSVINPTTVASYFIRITTYSDTAWATPVDSGVVAYATTTQITVNGRIQEVLNFCVGTTAVDDATTTPTPTLGDCRDISGTTVDIGVLDSSVINVSPVSTNGGSSTNGIAMLRTNAQSGAVISYFAEQDSTFGGAFKVVGQTCNGTTTDQCINSQGTTQASFTAGTEKFGMTVAAVNCVSTTSYTCSFTGGTYRLTRDTNYDGTGGNTYGVSQGYAWQDNGTASTLATSTSVVDDEALILKFAATPSITTPTGAYTVVSTYIATATF